MATRRKPIVYSLFVFLCLSVGNSIGQTSSDAGLQMRVSEFTSEGRDLAATLAFLARTYRVPIGFECSETEVGSAIRVKSNIKDAPLDYVVESIVRQNQDYSWEFRGGVIYVFPARSRNERVRRILMTKIKLYAPMQGISRSDLKAYLAQLPELEHFFRNKPFGVSVDAEPFVDTPLPADSLRPLFDVDLRTVLNEIAKSTEQKFWYVQNLNDDAVLISF